MKRALKFLGRLTASIVAFPLGLLSGFGRVEALYHVGTQVVSLLPGIPGDYVRTGYYRWTLQSFGADSRIQFGSYFAHAEARVGDSVYIGSYCILGRTEIGDRTQIASGVQVLSGRRQHGRGEDGKIEGARIEKFQTVRIGADCWIGAGVILMADVGEGSTVGAGAVVVKPLPPGVVAVGNPARELPEAPLAPAEN
ncbi:MAG: acyltransferase [Bryobacterales bacterium]|nr:acyltransferase [Bryobacterales bacterium]